ncbi:MAG: homoserine dehydrogenase [Alphaproteobacteria bacterium]|nr:homoserine dehydrogenase [Alphaproteobacteria bacterium]
MSDAFRIALAGLGTVGSGVVKLLQENGDLVAARAGRPVEIVAACARETSRIEELGMEGCAFVADPMALAEQDCDAVVELMGGEGDPALSLVRRTLEKGRAAVTANKAMIARHGLSLAEIAEKNGAVLAYEAAVAGGIPIIKSLREGFVGNRIDAVYGILNGTCNYILSEMQHSGRSFDDVLAEAQAQGYAEADPTFDVDGIDAAHKLSILTGLAFGIRPDFEKLKVNGIRRITATDIQYAGDLGYVVRLLGISRRSADGGDEGIVQMVEPCLVPGASALGSIEGVFNAVQVEGDRIGQGLAIGRGAGAGPTASAVVSDIVDAARGRMLPVYGVPVAALGTPRWIDVGALRDRFYLRLEVLDQPGVVADVSAILRDHRVSIEAMLQRGRAPGQAVSVVLTTHEAPQVDIARACEEIAQLQTVLEAPCILRIEEFEPFR